MSLTLEDLKIRKAIRLNAPTEELKVSKIIYNYRQKTDQQIKDIIQLEIDTVQRNNPDYRYKDSKSHFNKIGGIDLLLNFELV